MTSDLLRDLSLIWHALGLQKDHKCYEGILEEIYKQWLNGIAIHGNFKMKTNTTVVNNLCYGYFIIIMNLRCFTHKDLNCFLESTWKALLKSIRFKKDPTNLTMSPQEFQNRFQCWGLPRP